MEENLNTIQEGMATAVENSIKSERMKVELITNISHDLKTPYLYHQLCGSVIKGRLIAGAWRII